MVLPELISKTRPENKAVFLFFPLAALLLFFCVRVVLPADLYSTALWFDQLGIQLVFDESMRVGGPIAVLDQMIPGTASTEGLAFSAVLILGQMFFTMLIIRSGDWLKRGGGSFASTISGLVKRDISFSDVNAQKFTFMMIWIFCVVFDAYTSVSFRASTVGVTLPIVITIAVFYENIMSEILFTESAAALIGLVLLALSQLKDSLIGSRGRRNGHTRTPSVQVSGGQSSNRRQGSSQQSRTPDPGLRRVLDSE